MKNFYDNCQVFTPDKIVDKTLDIVKYKNNLYGKKVLENSCGDGQFLQKIAERYILDCLKKGMWMDDISKGLENDLYGVEIDEKHYFTCMSNLEKLRNKYNLPKVKWNIFLGDCLRSHFNIKFDFVIGNPPYITYSDLDIDTRKFIKEKYQSCKLGKPDYYYAFIESSIDNLSENGSLAYLIPNNIFKNKFACTIREFMKPYLTDIYDYDGEKLFKNRLTTSSIIICKKAENPSYINYFNIPLSYKDKFEKKDLTNKWIFSNVVDNKQFKFGDFFKVSVAIATLCNEAFVIENYQYQKTNILVEGIPIECDAVRKCASPRSLTLNRKEYIIFPYYYDSHGEVNKYGDDFEKKFPNTIKYLERFKDKLLKRKADNSANWFEYGRSQALSHINQDKLLISTLVSRKVRVNRLNADVVTYSGIVITASKNLDLDIAIRILESSSFFNYVQKIGIKSNGESVRISPIDIANYTFNLED